MNKDANEQNNNFNFIKEINMRKLMNNNFELDIANKRTKH